MKNNHRNLPRGENHHRARLTPDLVRWIRAEWNNGRSQSSMARELGIAQTTISAMLTGKTWRHVK